MKIDRKVSGSNVAVVATGPGRVPILFSLVRCFQIVRFTKHFTRPRLSLELSQAKPAKQFGDRLPYTNRITTQYSAYLESKALTSYLYELVKLSAQPLKSVETDFAVDSSGFSTGQFMRWFDVKYGEKEDRRMWLKLHLMCGVKTNIVSSVEVSDGYANAYHFYKGLVDQTKQGGFGMKERRQSLS
ncbi:MAG TPA: transposase [Pyrinomonadaceae bacterium]|nr:transposase [Pyrinomonadaceae bacterium]